MKGKIEKIYVTPAGGQAMEAVREAHALTGRGLQGDRYCEKTGHWSRWDECEVTLIQAEHLEAIQRTTGIRVERGEHRRNLVTRGIELEQWMGKRFRVGEAVLVFVRPRPPCSYIESITQPGMTRALVGRSGICARVLESGTIRPDDPILVLQEDAEVSASKNPD